MIDIPYALQPIILQILKKHVPDHEVRVIGSRAGGTPKPYSDLDLVIMGDQELPKVILYALKEDFEESELPFRVDLIDWHAASAEFRAVINKRYEVLRLDGDR